MHRLVIVQIFTFSEFNIAPEEIFVPDLNDDVVGKKKKKNSKSVRRVSSSWKKLPPGSKVEKKERENPRISFITVI